MRFLSIACISLMVLLSSAHSWAADPMIVSGTPDGPPVSWEKSGKLVGTGPELAAKILTELKVPFSITPSGNWQQVQDKAKAGEVDMIVSAYANDERRTYMEYSVPYLASPVVIVVKKNDIFPVTSWDSLIGKKGVAGLGESFGEKFDTFIKKRLDVQYLSYQRAFEMLELDTADYLIIDLYPAVIYSKLLNVEDKIDFLDRPITIQYFHMTISKKSPYLGLLPKINTAINTFKKDGQIKKMVMEHYKKWNKTFQERQRFFARQKAQANQEQVQYNAGARDRGLEALGQFIERNSPYMGSDLP